MTFLRKHRRLLWMASSLTLLAMTIFGLAVQAQETGEPRPVYVLEMDGAIAPAFSGYLKTGLQKARDNNAQLLLIELDTPGGLLSTTREMVTMIVESSIPVAVWVTPSGAHAASAGTFIMYAAHIAAMNSGTNIGAATPIEMRGQLRSQTEEDKTKNTKEQTDKESSSEKDLQEILQDIVDPNKKAMRQKAIKDTAAFIRGLAEMRDRNVEWAERAVTEADSLTADEALEKNVIDYMAISRAELLEQIDGQSIALKNGDPVTLSTKNAPVIAFPPDWKVKLLTYITDPNVALILMSIGVYGLILEFYNPGALLPGTVGAISLILALYALNVLPINAAGIALLLLGIGFMIAEAFIPSFGIIGFGGVVAFLIGATIMFDTQSMPGLVLDWGVIAGVGIFGILVVALIVYLTARVYKQKISTGTESMIDELAEVIEWKDKSGRVRIHGEIWHAESDTPLKVKQGDDVTISSVEHLKLKVKSG